MNSQEEREVFGHTEKQLERLAGDLLRDSTGFSRALIRGIESLAGDASGRRYYRLYLDGAPCATVTLMILNQAKGPVGGGRENKSQDDTFVELAGFFRDKGIRVPMIFKDARPMGALLVEDVGDHALWHFARNEVRLNDHPVTHDRGEDPTTLLYRSAIEIIQGLQAIDPDPSSVAFQRYATFEQYRNEISGFIDYFAEPRGIRPTALAVVERAFDHLSESLSSHPRTLSHFDFMSHNIYVTAEGELIVIDFQDACTVSPVRDIVSLINDRDIDIALGKDRHRELLTCYKEALETDERFETRYNECLLHWDLRVTGRFLFLDKKKNIQKYQEWVPGTLRRIGRTLWRMEKSMPGADDLIGILLELSPEIREGLNDPWPL